jgi:hypothetical protein
MNAKERSFGEFFFFFFSPEYGPFSGCFEHGYDSDFHKRREIS